MEDIKDRLGEYKYIFFKKLQSYLDTELYFYGSIKRIDYINNSSDIDILVITDNVKSMLAKVQLYLNVNNYNTHKIFQQHNIYDKQVIKGYKIKYINRENDIEFDLLIYDEKYRNAVLQNVHDINNFPLYILVPLYILKILYYKLHFISKKIYINIKCTLFDSYFNGIRYYNKEKAQVIMIDIF
jgi:predicted nucleotidyltransferase